MHKIAIAAVTVSSVLLFGACGDDAEDEDVARFCDDVEAMEGQIGDTTDPQARADTLGRIDPPAGIAEDWNTMVALMVEVTQADIDTDDAEVDPDELEALEELQERIDEFNMALGNVERYVRAECDLSL